MEVPGCSLVKDRSKKLREVDSLGSTVKGDKGTPPITKRPSNQLTYMKAKRSHGDRGVPTLLTRGKLVVRLESKRSDTEEGEVQDSERGNRSKYLKGEPADVRSYRGGGVAQG